MSFTFNWPRFSDQFHYDAIQMLNTALNKGNKPPIIADRIEVVELEMGTQPPELEIRDIGDLTVDQFRGIFRLTYCGDAHLVLKTKVQANPLNHKQSDIHLLGGSRGMLAAKQPLVVPMLLRLSHFKLNSYVVLVVSKQKGITLVFKTDPLQNVDINSTFDSIAVIQKFIQREIEGQLRQMFREDLPSIIHRLSQQWVKAKVEAPYLHKNPPVNRQRGASDTQQPTHEDGHHTSPHDSVMYLRSPPRAPSTAGPSSRRPSVSVGSAFDAFDNLDDISPSTSPSHNPKIVLRPSLNNNITQLSTLSYSNHTLSPYTRNLQHFTVRSVPPRSAAPSGLAALDRQPIKAKRKRIFHLGGAKKPPIESEAGSSKPKKPPNGKASEFDVSDMDRYFPTHDDDLSVDLNVPHTAPPLSTIGPLSPTMTHPRSISPSHLRHPYNADNANVPLRSTLLP
ncbi:Mitochondrial distribution and morphology protein 34 [Termitomyces sp. J132]|nr:Mitochondrial distribution and morphology protein 34 [Termitomyces sp. J132]